MNPPDPVSNDSLLDEHAAEWLFEREEGFAPGRADAFMDWCNADPRHAEAVARIEETLFLLDDLPAVRGALEERVGAVIAPPAAPKTFRFKPALWTAGLAASLVLGFTAWRSFPLTLAEPQSFAAETTAPRRVALRDGSIVDLNARSQVQVKFTESERLISLSTGEAHFQVAHNAARPFIVTAGDVRIRAVGTAFNVRLHGDQVDVLVTEGRVEIERLGSPTTGTGLLLPVLVAGERAQVPAAISAAPRVGSIEPAIVHELLSWQDRMTSFADVPLQEMVARINRCNSTQLVLGDPSLGDRRIGGAIDLRQVEAFVRLLEQEGDITAERRYNGEIVLRRAR